MYSILIQNQSTMESFHEYHPFFMEKILNNQIGFCRWVESGNSVDTALPELCEMTADKESWRAIIVRLIDENEPFETDPINPYDFKINYEGSNALEESPIPLVRLTHILGGVPAPTLEFRKDEIRVEGGVPQVVYTPIRDPEKDRRHHELEEKYGFNGKRPSEIYVVTFHKKGQKKESEKVQFMWNNYLESDSSEFWKRNNYPANCRFLKYDYEELGPVQKMADMFNFWMSIMLLASNSVNPSSLQGYRVYNLHTDFDHELLDTAFQERVNILVGTKNYVGMEIKRDQEEKATIDETAVMDFSYSDGPDINVSLKDDEILKADDSEFALCGKTSSGEAHKWEGIKGTVEDNLDTLYKLTDRELEKRTDIMRLKQHIEDEDVKPINHFQEEDIRESLDNLFVQILNSQGELSGLSHKKQEKLDEKSNLVKEEIRRRVSGQTAKSIFSYVLILILVGCVPSIFLRKIDLGPTLLPSFLMIIGILLIYLLAEIISLVIQLSKFRGKIDAYNDEVEQSKISLENCSKNLSSFVRDVVSYSRGYDYLNILEQRKFKTGHTYDALVMHLKATNLFLDKLRKWSKAFYLDTNFSPVTKDNFRIDIELSPQKNYLYTFENGKEYAVPLNETGEVIQSPFVFVKKFNIDREELFEHDRNIEGDSDTGSDSTGVDDISGTDQQ